MTGRIAALCQRAFAVYGEVGCAATAMALGQPLRGSRRNCSGRHKGSSGHVSQALPIGK
jgi:hypothetical protein